MFVKQFAVLVAGLPRSGTSMMYETLLREGYRVGKTHALHPSIPYESRIPKMPKPYAWDPKREEDVRIIFLFGSIMDSVVSTRYEGLEMNKVHWRNCGYFGDEQKDIMKEDFLNYNKMIENWLCCAEMKNKNWKYLYLKYESLWNNLAVVESFLEMDTRPHWPKYRPRRFKANEEILIYKKTEEIIRQQHDVQIFL